ncbi:MAG: hypothetical protein RIR97_1189 [Pseudomonadota bacterium]
MKLLSDYQIGLVFVTLSAIAWSTAGFFTRLIDLDSFTMLAWRGVFGSAALLVVIIVQNGRGWTREFTRMGRVEYAYAALCLVGMIMFIVSLDYTSVAHNAVIYATLPFVSAFLAWFAYREFPTRKAIIASLFALVGVFIMAGFGSDGGLFGDVLSFGMTITMAISILLLRRYRTMAANAGACVGGLASGLLCMRFGQPLDVTGLQFFYLFLFGVVNSAIGLAFFAIGSRKIPAIETALIGSLDAPMAPFWVWIAFSETPGWATIVGGTIVLFTVVTHIWLTQRYQPSAAI